VPPHDDDQLDEEEEQHDPEADAAMARDAFAERDLPHAAFHAASALSGDPMNSEWRELLDKIIDAADDPLKLAPLEEENSFVTVALRAYVLARLGNWPDAIDLCLQVAAVRPDIPYLLWANQWIQQPGAAEAVDTGDVVSALAALFESFPGLYLENDEERGLLAPALPVVNRILDAHPGDSRLVMFTAMLSRKLGLFEEAHQLAERAFALEPCWETATEVAASLRLLGDIDRALEAYRRAVSFDPSDHSARLDAADMLCEEGRLAEGLSLYNEVLEADPEHDWALPSYLYFHYRLTGDRDSSQKLSDLAAADPDNDRARTLASQLDAS
jgi:tetratricopeptide (TPR) repeat protein